MTLAVMPTKAPRTSDLHRRDARNGRSSHGALRLPSSPRSPASSPLTYEATAPNNTAITRMRMGRGTTTLAGYPSMASADAARRLRPPNCDLSRLSHNGARVRRGHALRAPEGLKGQAPPTKCDGHAVQPPADYLNVAFCDARPRPAVRSTLIILRYTRTDAIGVPHIRAASTGCLLLFPFTRNRKT
jgi:hypothetical protein